MNQALITLLNAGLAANYTDRVVSIVKVEGMVVTALVECPESKIQEVCTLRVGTDGSVDYCGTFGG